MEALLSVSPWRELFWLAVGGIFFSLLCVSGALLRAALWPPPRAIRRTAETRTATVATATGSDDLETIEGIGPAIAALLRAQGIRTFAELASYRAAQLRQMLRRDRDLALAEPSTWAFQARLLAEGRYGDFVRLIAMLNCGVPRLCNIEGLEECCAGRLRAGGICTVAELQRSTVAQIVNCFPQNDRAQVTRWAPRWIEHAQLLHEGDEAALCALAGIGRPSGQVRAEARRTAVRTATAGETNGEAADAALVAYWRRESLLRLLCAPLGGLALLLLLLLIALFGLIRPPHPGPWPGMEVRGGGTTISMIQGGWPPNGPYGPYPPYYPPVYQPGYPSPYPWPYPPPYPSPYPQPYPPGPGTCCPTCPQANCPPTPTPTPTPTPAPTPTPTPTSCACEVCGCEADAEAAGM